MAKKMPKGWGATRKAVYQRDGAKCRVCKIPLPDTWWAGHLVDRCIGGEDTAENVVVMCYYCNRVKPLHYTLADALAWVNSNGPVWQVLAGLTDADLGALEENLRAARG